MRPRFKRIMMPLLTLGLLANAYLILATPHLRPLFSLEYWSNLNEMGRVMRLVHANYIDEDAASFDDLTRHALEGMLSQLDEHSRFIPRTAFDNFEEIAGQKYVGVGLDVAILQGRPVVIRTFEGSSGSTAGVQPGDIIKAINGESTHNLSGEEIVERLRGQEGTQVKVTLERGDAGTPVEVELQRTPVALATVLDTSLDEDGIGYLRISHFGAQTPVEFSAALDELERKGMKALVIDLRNNPGGLLVAGMQVAAEYFKEGEVVVYTRARGSREITQYVSDTPARSDTYPVAVLINPHTASAAEIVAGALQDIGRAVIIGEKSYGKASVQEVFVLASGDAVQATTAHYFTPSGRSLHEKGIEPDVPLKVPPEDYLKLEVHRRHAHVLDDLAFEKAFGFARNTPDIQRESTRALMKQMLKKGRGTQAVAVLGNRA